MFLFSFFFFLTHTVSVSLKCMNYLADGFILRARFSKVVVEQKYDRILNQISINMLQNRNALRTCGSLHLATSTSSCLSVIGSRNSTRYCFSIVNHYSAMVDVLDK